MRQKNRHFATISPKLVKELENLQLVKKSKDGRQYGLSLICDRALRDLLRGVSKK